MAAPAHVQAVSFQALTAVASVDSPSFTSTSGNLLVASGTNFTTTAEGATPYSDNKGNAWTVAAADTQDAGNSFRASQRYAKNIVGGAGHIVTYTPGASGTCTIAVEEISGADTAAPLDKNGVNAPATGANPHNCASITPSVADTLAVASITHGGVSNETFAATGTGTVRTSQTNTGAMPLALSTDTRADASAIVEGYNLTPNTTEFAIMLVSNYKSATGVPGIMGRGPFLYPNAPR